MPHGHGRVLNIVKALIAGQSPEPVVGVGSGDVARAHPLGLFQMKRNRQAHGAAIPAAIGRFIQAVAFDRMVVYDGAGAVQRPVKQEPAVVIGFENIRVLANKLRRMVVDEAVEGAFLFGKGIIRRQGRAGRLQGAGRAFLRKGAGQGEGNAAVGGNFQRELAFGASVGEQGDEAVQRQAASQRAGIDGQVNFVLLEGGYELDAEAGRFALLVFQHDSADKHILCIEAFLLAYGDTAGIWIIGFVGRAAIIGLRPGRRPAMPDGRKGQRPLAVKKL